MVGTPIPIDRGSICWVDLGVPLGSAPAKRRPVLVIQADSYLRSRISTLTVAVITSNTGLAELPGNVFLPANASGLPKDSVVNVTQLLTLDRSTLGDPVARLPPYLLSEVDAGVRRALAL
jgi:mRNA interferase MazF